MLDGVILLWFVLAALAVAVRRDRHPQHARVAGAQIGVRAAHRLHRGRRRFPLCPRLPRAAAWNARAVTPPRAGARRSDRQCIAWRATASAFWSAPSLSSLLGLTGPAEVALEYLLGFGFGWTIFQALFMREGPREALIPLR